MQEQQQCAGAVLGGFPPGSVGAKQYAGVYRTCGENEGMPHFVGAEEQNSDKRKPGGRQEPQRTPKARTQKQPQSK